MKTLKRILAIIVVSLVLFACEAESLEAVNIDNEETLENPANKIDDGTILTRSEDEDDVPEPDGGSEDEDDVPEPDGMSEDEDDVPEPDGGSEDEDDVPEPDGGSEDEDDVPEPDGGSEDEDDVPEPDTD